MKYKIQWQDRWGKWQHYQTKTNEADAFRVMKQMVKQKGIRHRIVDENNSLIDLLHPREYENPSSTEKVFASTLRINYIYLTLSS